MNKLVSLIAQFTFLLLFLRGILGNYDVKTIYLTIFINVLLMYLIFSVRFSGRLLIILAWGFLAVFHNKDALALIDLALFTYVLQYDRLSKYINWGYICYAGSFIAILSLLQMNIIHNEEIQYVHKGKVIANSMGMGSSNMTGGNPNLAGQFFYLLFMFSFLRYTGRKYASDIWLAIAISLLSYIAFEFTQARAAFYSALILSIFVIFMPIIRRFKLINKICLSLAPSVLAIVSLYISLNQNSFYELDKLATDRVSNPAFIIAKMETIDWLIGTNIPDDMAMDSSYLTILFEGGVPAFLLIFCILVVRIWRNYDTIIKWEPMIVSVLAYGCLENIFSSFNCLSVIFFTFIICSNNKYHCYGRKQSKNLCANIVHESA